MIETATLESSTCKITLLNLGCITQSWGMAHWPDTRSAVLGYRNALDYQTNPHFMGAIVGRVANRISGGGFDLDGQFHAIDQNEGSNTLHGGVGGLSSQIWQMDRDGRSAVQFDLMSKDGDQGFPGDVHFTVLIRLDGNTLTYEMRARSNAPTPIAMTQHNYYTLSKSHDLAGHLLQVPADTVLQTDDAGIPTQLTAVHGTSLDFSEPRKLSKSDHAHLDSNFCLNGNFVSLRAEDTALSLETDQVGLQVYTGGKLSQIQTPFGTQTHAPFSGVCLEPQAYPNAVNRPDFPSIIVTPDTPYRQVLRITLSEVRTS